MDRVLKETIYYKDYSREQFTVFVITIYGIFPSRYLRMVLLTFFAKSIASCASATGMS